MKNIMLDLETISTKSNAGIISIGACYFDPTKTGVLAEFEISVSVQSSIQAGLHQEESTMQWWDKQSIEAKQKAFPENAYSLITALNKLTLFITNISTNKKEIAIWGNGATFDNVIIRNAYQASGMSNEDIPWDFRNDKCYRTVINLIPKEKQPKFERIGIGHNALDDAISQALHLQKCWKILNLT